MKPHRLDAGQQALLVLVHLRKGESFTEIGAGFGVSATTYWRYVNETVELLATRAPKLRQAIADGETPGLRVRGSGRHADPDRPDRRRPPFSSGKHTMHGVNLRVIVSPEGDILWVSGDLPAVPMTPPRPGSGTSSPPCATLG